MTEAEWFTEENPARLDLYLLARQSVRKSRLVKCGYLRRELALAFDEKANLALALAERYADEPVAPEELEKAREEAKKVFEQLRVEHDNLNFRVTATLASPSA